MLSITLVSIATIMATFKKGKQRLLVCICVLLPAMAHYLLFNDKTGFEYYGTAAVASLIVISCLEPLKRSPLALDIQVINLLYLVAHLFGFVMYHSYMEPYAYNAIVLVLFLIEFARLIITTKKDEAHGTCNRFNSLHTNDSRGSLGCHR